MLDSDSSLFSWIEKGVRHPDFPDNYIKHIKETSGVKDIEVLSYENPDGDSLTKIYNKALKDSKNNIVLFCHDDIIFNTKKWGKKLLKHFSISDWFDWKVVI